MLNNFILIYVSPWISNDQHGYFPQRGTMSAIKVLLTKIIHSKSIYEFDLRKLFDTINLDYLEDILLKLGVDPEIVTHMIRCNRTAPISGERPQVFKSLTHEAHLYKYHKTRVWGFPGGIAELHNWLNKKRIEEKANPDLKEAGYFLGVSQGNPLSPVLSTLLLNPLLLFGKFSLLYKILMYADDGILYAISPDVEITEILKFPPESGIEIHPTKSKWVKRFSNPLWYPTGEWLSPLKFLGVLFIPPLRGDFIQNH